MAVLTDEIWGLVLAHEDTQLNSPAEQADISVFEESYRLRLSQTHREFLLRANGGYVGHILFFPIIFIGRRRDVQPSVPAGPLLTFAWDERGTHSFCYNTQETSVDGQHPIYSWDHEWCREPELSMLGLFRAGSLVEFLLQVVS